MESGVEFNFSFAPGITEEQIIGIELAGEMWSNYLDDTQQIINLHVEIGSDLLPDNVIGGSFPAITDDYKYDDIYDALNQDITTSIDQIATDSLLDGDKTQVLVNGNLIENDKFQLTTANLKALDLIDSSSTNGQELDGYILMSDLSQFNSIKWNYDYLGGAKEGTLDFLTTVTHEIGHALGFISGTDRIALTSETLENYQNVALVNVMEQAKLIEKEWRYTAKLDGTDNGSNVNPYDWGSYFSLKPSIYSDYGKFREARNKFEEAIDTLYNSGSSLDGKTAHQAFESIENYLKYNEKWEEFIANDELFQQAKDNLDPNKLAEKMTSLDLFRYSNESSSLGANELTRGSSSHFSLDGFETDLAMSHGLDYQGSHWQDRNNIEGLGIMNPTISLNERLSISRNDLMAMDAIGWDVNYDRTLDMEALYNKASAAVDSAWIENRQDDVDDILNSDAYDARRSRAVIVPYDARRSRAVIVPYDARRSRAVRVPHAMSIDGYFSTFSEPVAALTGDVSNEVVAQIHDLPVVSNDNNRDAANNIVPVAKADSLINLAKSVSQVAAEYLEIDNSREQDDLLQEIKASLTTGLEIAIATSTL